MNTIATWRAYLYPVLMAVIAVAGAYGLVDDQQAALWGALAAAVVGVGTAAVYTRPPSKPEPPKTPERVLSAADTYNFHAVAGPSSTSTWPTTGRHSAGQ